MNVYIYIYILYVYYIDDEKKKKKDAPLVVLPYSIIVVVLFFISTFSKDTARRIKGLALLKPFGGHGNITLLTGRLKAARPPSLM